MGIVLQKSKILWMRFSNSTISTNQLELEKYQTKPAQTLIFIHKASYNQQRKFLHFDGCHWSQRERGIRELLIVTTTNFGLEETEPMVLIGWLVSPINSQLKTYMRWEKFDNQVMKNVIVLTSSCPFNVGGFVDMGTIVNPSSNYMSKQHAYMASHLPNHRVSGTAISLSRLILESFPAQNCFLHKESAFVFPSIFHPHKYNYYMINCFSNSLYLLE